MTDGRSGQAGSTVIALAVALSTVAAGAACVGDASPEAVSVARDSAGVAIIENDPAASADTCVLTSEATVSIGVAEGAPEQQLYRVFDAARLSDGRIAVVNQGSGEVRLYRADGAYGSAFGREGEGPGEFRRAFQLWRLPGDTLVVGDYRPWRFHLFRSDGTFLRTVVPEPRYQNPPVHSAVLEDGSFLLATECCRSDGPGFEDTDLWLLRHRRDGAFADTVAGPFSRGRWGRLGPPEIRFTATPLFEPSARVAVRGDRIAVGLGDRPEVRVLDPTGTLRRLFRWETGDRAIDQEEVEAYRTRLVERAEGDPSPFIRALVSEERPVADRFPAHATILPTTEGRWWVGRYRRPSETGPDRWLTFDESGRFVCHVATPEPLQIYEVGPDYVLGEVQDEMGVERVVMYGLEGPDAGAAVAAEDGGDGWAAARTRRADAVGRRIP